MIIPDRPTLNRRKLPLIFDGLHYAHCLKIISKFVNSQRLVLTRSSCLTLLDHECGCGAVHTKSFLGQCVTHHIPSSDADAVVNQHKVLLHSSNDLVRVASFRKNRSKSEKAFDFDELTTFSLSSHQSLQTKLSNCALLTSQNLPFVWRSSKDDHPMEMNELTRMILHGSLAVRLLQENIVTLKDLTGLHCYNVDFSNSTLVWALRYEVGSEQHFAIISALDSSANRMLGKAIRHLVSLREDTVVSLFCLKESLQSWGFVLSFVPGTTFEITVPTDELTDSF